MTCLSTPNVGEGRYVFQLIQLNGYEFVHRCRKIQAVDSANILMIEVEKQCDSSACGGCRVAVDHGKQRATSVKSDIEIIVPVFKQATSCLGQADEFCCFKVLHHVWNLLNDFCV